MSEGKVCFLRNGGAAPTERRGGGDLKLDKLVLSTELII